MTCKQCKHFDRQTKLTGKCKKLNIMVTTTLRMSDCFEKGENNCEEWWNKYKFMYMGGKH